MADPPTVEFCTRNVDMAAYRALQGADLDVRQQHCLGRCGPCREGPFLVIDGRLVRGEHEALLEPPVDPSAGTGA